MAMIRTRTGDGIDGKDSVGLYLDEIARTPLLTAEQEVHLARTIEVGLYAEHILSGDVSPADRRAAAAEREGLTVKRPTAEELEFLVAEGRHLADHVHALAALLVLGDVAAAVRPSA